MNTADEEQEMESWEEVTEEVDVEGRTILVPRKNGEKIRALVQRAAQDKKKYALLYNDKVLPELLTYQQVLEHLDKDAEDDRVWKYKEITGHKGPLRKGDEEYKGSTWNLHIEWENGEQTWEPLHLLAQDDPVSCAKYAKEQQLLNTDGWKRFRRIARREKKMMRQVNQAKLRSFRTAPRYKYGIEVPRDFKHAMELDRAAGNNKWKESIDLELRQLTEYKAFKDLGKGTPLPEGYKKIRVHLVFDVKHDLRRKARLVAGGHLTDVPVDSVYSGVVSLRGLRLVLFLGELNKVETWATDVGNAYLEAYTLEKVGILAGPEFGTLEGHTLIISKALYGLRSSGLRWHEKLADCLRDEGFFPCKAEPDIWMRKAEDHYEYVAVYVDDLAFSVDDPKQFVKTLEGKYGFKLKGTGPLSFHLGCDFYRDNTGTLCMSPKKYLERIAEGYKSMFGSKPKTNVWSPLEHGDHPELDATEELDQKGVEKYQSLIGSLQWAVSLGRFDIATAVMTLSSFRAVPRTGHLERAKRVVSYLMRFKEAAIRFRTGTPDLSDLAERDDRWKYSVYGEGKESLPNDAPDPLGRKVRLTHYVDANLYHDWTSGRSVSGILHFVNQTPMDWFTKKQATVETATFGSEYVAARICVEQVIDLRTTLRYLGVPVEGKSVVFGDNESVVNSSVRMDGKLHKRHNALAYHRVREAVAHGWIGFYHIPGKMNPADILSKHWAYSDVWSTLQPILHWEGDTATIYSDKAALGGGKEEDK